MDTWAWIVVAVAVIAVLAAAAWWVSTQQRRRQLQEGFGPEYDRTVSEAPSRREAEAELLARKERHDELDIRPLVPESRERYAREWEGVQARFVDDPHTAIRDADSLIQTVMRERGYPVDDFERRSSDLSVDYPHVVEHYRAGHAIASRNADADGDADTEEMRQAVIHYRALFAELLESSDTREGVRR